MFPSELKTLLKIKKEDDSKDESLELYYKIVKSKALVYCNRDDSDIPEGLNLLILEMTSTAFGRFEAMAGGEEIAGKSVTSIHRGDTTINYSDNKEKITSGTDFLANYRLQLDLYKKNKAGAEVRFL